MSIDPFHDRRRARHRRIPGKGPVARARLLAGAARSVVRTLLLAAASASLPALALDASAPLLHDGHKAWRVQEGELAAAPYALAQTKDGYLWIGTSAGLVHFDGVNFKPLPATMPLSNEIAYALLAARNGDLWIGADSGLLRLHDGKIARLAAGARVEQLSEDGQGTVWFTRSRTRDVLGALGRITGEQPHYVGKSEGLPLQMGRTFAIQHDGSVWLGTGEGLLRWDGHAATLNPMDTRSSSSGSDGPEAMVTGPDGSLWAGYAADSSRAGLLHRVDGRWTQVALPGLGDRVPHISRLLFDRHDVLWIGTVDHGLYRWRDGEIEHVGVEDGLSGDGVTALAEDAEGNLWVGTTRGLDRFSDLRVGTFSSRDGLAANSVESAAAAPDGSLWIGDLAAVEQLRDGRVVRSLRVGEAAGGAQFTTVFIDRSGRVWAGVDDDLAVLEGDRFKRIRMADGKPIGLIVDIAQDADGAIWALPVPGLKRMVRVVDDHVVDVLTPPKPYLRVLGTPDGALWMSTDHEHSLTRYKDGHLDVFPYPKLPRMSNILGLRPGPDGTIVASSATALVAWRGGESRALTVADGLPCDRLFGVTMDSQQALWLYGSCGLMKLTVESYRAWWARPGTKVSVRTYDAVDGAAADSADFGTSGTLTADGKVWFVNGSALQMVNPPNIHDNTVPPPVHIDAVVADHASYPLAGTVRLGTHPADVEIDYSAPSFVAPRKVLFRYRLDGHDTEWQSAGQRRQAFYTDLKPGHYTFRVVACNDDGLWNLQGADIAIDVPPTFTQTRWFVALCIAAATLALWGLFQYRLREIRARLDARINERERIARELHDTLLQSAHGLIMVLQARLGRIGLEASERAALDKAVARANDLVVEGRNRIYDLRTPPSSSSEFFASMKADGEALDIEGSRFQAVSTGRDRTIEHGVREEIHRIAGEALANAFRHSSARTITLRMDVGDRGLDLSVSDDGVGTAQEPAVPAGADRHWGITGMRERAARIGARLQITSAPREGTQVRLQVPASRVFGAPRWRIAWPAFWRRRMAG